MNWLRENTKPIIVLTCIAFVATIFFGWGMNYLSGQQQQRSLAVVNGQEISFNEFQRVVDRVRQQYRQQNPGPITADELNTIRKRSFRQLINRIILQETLEDVGITASDAQVRSFIQQRYFTNEQGQLQRRQWRRFLQGASPQRKRQLETAQRRQIETTRMQQWLSSQVTVSNLEFKRMLRVGLREADLYGIFLKPGQYIDDERIQDYYLGNDESFQAPPRARVRTIFFKGRSTDTPATNRRQQLTDMKDQLDTIRRQFQAGDPFSELAREFSEDTGTREDGGLIGWVTPEELSDRKSRAIFQLESEEMSNLVPTENGYNLYYVEEGPVQEKLPLPTVRDQIVRRLRSDTHWQAAEDEAERLHSQIKESQAPFDQFRDSAQVFSHGKTADEGGHYGWVPARFIVPSLHTDADTASWQGEIANRFFVNQTVSSTVFADTESALRQPVRSENGVHLFYVNEIREARVDDLSDTDSRRIRQVLRREKEQTFLNRWLERRREQASIELNVPDQQVGGPVDEL
jgi:peptidyl-prolyl cis-trans isomerase D